MESRIKKTLSYFLDKESFLKLQHDLLSSRYFPWYFQDRKDLEYTDKETQEDLNQAQFTHVLYGEDKPLSDWFNLTPPLLKKLKVKSLINK